MIIPILILAAVLRLISLNQSFWLDEAIQAVISSKPLTSINFGADFQPPLFYIISHFRLAFALKFGINSEWFLRGPSVFFGILTVFLTYYFLKKLFDKKAGLLAAFFLGTAPYHIYYSQEFRMYSLLTLLILASWIFLWQRRWVLYGLTILLSVFTHYFAFFAILSQFIYMFLCDRKNVSRFTLQASLFLSPFLLWLPTVYKQLETVRNLTSLWPKWKEILGVSFFKFPALTLAKFIVGVTSPNKIIYSSAVIIVGIIFFMMTSKLFRFRTSGQHSTPPEWRLASLGPKETLLFIYFFVPLIIAWILSLWVSGNSPHRLLFVLPAFYGILAAGLSKIKNKNLKIALIAIVLISNISFSGFYLLNPKNHRENWRDAVAFTDKTVGERGVVLSEFQGPWAPMVWYSKKPEKYLGALSMDHRIKTADKVILYTYLFEVFDPERKTEKQISQNGFKLVEEKDFRGVGIIKIFSR